MEGVCGGCLTPGRLLRVLGDNWTKRLAAATHKSVQNDALSKLPLCWECTALLHKSLLLHARVTRAHAVLTDNHTAVVNNPDASMSMLGHSTKIGFDFEFKHELNSKCASPGPSQVLDVSLSPLLVDYDEIESRLKELDAIDLNLDELIDVGINLGEEIQNKPIEYIEDITDVCSVDGVLQKEKVKINDTSHKQPAAIENTVRHGFRMVMQDLTRPQENKIKVSDALVTIKHLKGDNVKETKASKSSDIKNILSMVRKKEGKIDANKKRIKEKPKSQCLENLMMSEIQKKKGSCVRSFEKCDTCVVAFTTMCQHKNKHKLEVQVGCDCSARRCVGSFYGCDECTCHAVRQHCPACPVLRARGRWTDRQASQEPSASKSALATRKRRQSTSAPQRRPNAVSSRRSSAASPMV